MSEVNCSICLDRLVGEKDEMLRDMPVSAFLGCGHAFHETCVKQACQSKGVYFDPPRVPPPVQGRGVGVCPDCPLCGQSPPACKSALCRRQHHTDMVLQRLYFSGEEMHFARDCDLPEAVKAQLSVADQAKVFGINLQALKRDPLQDDDRDITGPDRTLPEVPEEMAKIDWHAGGYGTETFHKVLGGVGGEKPAAVKACVLAHLSKATAVKVQVERPLRDIVTKALEGHSTEVVKVKLNEILLSLDRFNSSLSATPALLVMNRLLIEAREREDALKLENDRLKGTYAMDGPNAVLKNIRETAELEKKVIQAEHATALAAAQTKIEALEKRNAQVEEKLAAYKTLFKDGCLGPNLDMLRQTAAQFQELVTERKVREEMLLELANESKAQIKALKAIHAEHIKRVRKQKDEDHKKQLTLLLAEYRAGQGRMINKQMTEMQKVLTKLQKVKDECNTRVRLYQEALAAQDVARIEERRQDANTAYHLEVLRLEVARAQERLVTRREQEGDDWVEKAIASHRALLSELDRARLR